MRRTLFIVTCLLLGCCATTPLQHEAQIDAQLAIVVDSIGAAIEREAADDWAQIDAGDSPEQVAARARLRKVFEPLVAAYATLREAQIAYKHALEVASDAGQQTAPEAPLRAVVAAWNELRRQGDIVGVRVPSVPAALLGGAQ